MVWVVLLASGRNRACRSGRVYSGPKWYSTCETAAQHLSYMIPSQDMPAGIGWNGGTGERKDPPERESSRSVRVSFFGCDLHDLIDTDVESVADLAKCLRGNVTVTSHFGA